MDEKAGLNAELEALKEAEKVNYVFIDSFIYVCIHNFKHEKLMGAERYVYMFCIQEYVFIYVYEYVLVIIIIQMIMQAYKAQVENLTDNVQGLEQDLIALQVCEGVYSYLIKAITNKECDCYYLYISKQ
jgi:hypothetical protein